MVFCFILLFKLITFSELEANVLIYSTALVATMFLDEVYGTDFHLLKVPISWKQEYYKEHLVQYKIAHPLMSSHPFLYLVNHQSAPDYVT